MLAATIHITTIAVIIIVVAKNSAEESSKDTNMDRKYINIHGFPHAPASDEKIGTNIPKSSRSRAGIPQNWIQTRLPDALTALACPGLRSELPAVIDTETSSLGCPVLSSVPAAPDFTSS